MLRTSKGAPQGLYQAGGAPQGVGAPSILVGPTGLPSGNSSFQYFLYFPEKIFVDFQRIPRTFISAQKQDHGSSAESSVSPG